MQAPTFAGVIFRMRPGASAALGAAARKRLGGAATSLFPNAGAQAAGGAAPSDEWLLVRLAPDRDANPWERAHRAVQDVQVGFADGDVSFAEPDLLQEFHAFAPDEAAGGTLALAGGFDDQNPKLPRGPGFAWHLRDDFSELSAARAQVGPAGSRARIAHLDTGYDPGHATVPARLLVPFARDFEGDEERPGAVDPGIDGLLRNPGHGTGTLSILAGNRVPELGDDFLGAAPEAEVIPIRIATSVVLFRTSALARSLDYVLRPTDAANPALALPPVDVVTLSMGGLASAAWAQAVNAAYEAGVCIVAAAGNNFSAGPLGGLPTRFIVHPARFRRVIAACGVMANRAPYYDLPLRTMQGCWGPTSKMATALSAFTPNTPWAEMGAPRVVDMNGAGTSSATPQIAAAAALWIARHRDALDAYPERWQRVEAVRHALFSTADRNADGGRPDKLGNGILQAREALAVAPPVRLAATPRDSASLALLRVLTGIGLAASDRSPRPRMLALEATQLMQLPPDPALPNPFDDVVEDPDLPAAAIAPSKLRRLVAALREHPRASETLRKRLGEADVELGGPRPVPAPGPRPLAPARPPPARPPLATSPPAPAPAHRRLRAFAFDPSVAERLETRDIGEIVLRVPWEDLAPGPVGEYLEVVDFDPSSGCFYEPVTLDDPRLLAQDGFAPSVGTPKFHQQMVYAVASLTIRHFERALGRRALWSPGPPPAGAHPRDDSHFVRRLRVYPHALLQANAFYDPARKALLFGYFRASDDDPGEFMPGGWVFTCLSHDIVAHETAHALLDGLHRKFALRTNPDVAAFHEAFADVVALLQHFTFPEIVRDQIARTRGSLRSQAHLLGRLATEFGRATGEHGALRDYIGRRDPATGEWRPHVPVPGEYERTVEPHARGAILVAAVFDAFLSIYERRTRDLFRIATGRSGVVADGDIDPDLVARLGDEASRTAEQVLGMCIRALDFVPPVDLTAGEFLRAVITADHDLVPDDDLGYRAAFIDAFRRRAIYPRGVRSLSEESLIWSRPGADRLRPSERLLDVFRSLRDRALEQLQTESREALFHAARNLRRDLHDRLSDALRHPASGASDAEFLGLDLGERASFEVHAARFAERVGPDGQHRPQCVVELLQRVERPVHPKRPELGKMPFEGGATIVVGLRPPEVRYVIRKRVGSASRLARQRAFGASQLGDLLRDTYFAKPPLSAQPA